MDGHFTSTFCVINTPSAPYSPSRMISECGLKNRSGSTPSYCARALWAPSVSANCAIVDASTRAKESSTRLPFTRTSLPCGVGPSALSSLTLYEYTVALWNAIYAK